MNKPPLPEPPAMAKRWVSALLALLVSVPIGLAPLLGNFDIPGFKAVLSLYPEALQNTALPLASVAMGLVAVSVQFFAQDKLNDRKVRGWFVKLFIALFVLLFSLAFVHNKHVVTIEAGPEAQPVSFVVAAARIADCGCQSSDSDAYCIQRIGLDQALLSACWPESEIRGASFLLTALYVLLMSGLGALVGLLVLRKQPT